VRNNPQYEWINLQVDATEEESAAMAAVGVTMYPGSIASFADTAGLIACLGCGDLSGHCYHTLGRSHGPPHMVDVAVVCHRLALDVG
jgi:hypothetical protein